MITALALIAVNAIFTYAFISRGEWMLFLLLLAMNGFVLVSILANWYYNGRKELRELEAEEAELKAEEEAKRKAEEERNDNEAS